MTRAEFTILVATADLPTANGQRKEHYFAQARAAKALRIRARKIGADLGRVETPAQLTVFVGKAHNGVWDLPNVSEKAILDGLVDAGVLPDDSTRYLKRVIKEEGPRHEVKGFVELRVVVETMGGV